jgi:hypothetical protein
MARPGGPRLPVLSQLQWLLEDLLDAVSHPLIISGLIAFTALLLLRSVVASS